METLVSPPPCIAAPAACPPPLTRRRSPGVLSQGPPHRRGYAPQHVRLHGAGQRPHPCGAALRPPLPARVPGQSRGGPGARGRGRARPSFSSVPRGVSLCCLCSEAPASVLSVFIVPCVVRRRFLFAGRRTWTKRSTTACGTRHAGTPPRAAPPSARTQAAAARAKADARARKLPGFLRAAFFVRGFWSWSLHVSVSVDPRARCPQRTRRVPAPSPAALRGGPRGGARQPSERVEVDRQPPDALAALGAMPAPPALRVTFPRALGASRLDRLRRAGRERAEQRGGVGGLARRRARREGEEARGAARARGGARRQRGAARGGAGGRFERRRRELWASTESGGRTKSGGRTRRRGRGRSAPCLEERD